MPTESFEGQRLVLLNNDEDPANPVIRELLEFTHLDALGQNIQGDHLRIL